MRQSLATLRTRLQTPTLIGCMLLKNFALQHADPWPAKTNILARYLRPCQVEWLYCLPSELQSLLSRSPQSWEPSTTRSWKADYSTVLQAAISSRVPAISQPPAGHGNGTRRSYLARATTKKVFTLRTFASWVKSRSTSAAHAPISMTVAMITKSGPADTR